MKPSIKVCGLTRVEDIDAAFSYGADYGGIIAYDKSPRFVEFSQMESLVSTIPKGKRVYVDVEPDIAKIGTALSIGFDFYQIHFDSTINHMSIMMLEKYIGMDRLWLAPRIAPTERFPEWIYQYTDQILIDAYDKDSFGGTGHADNWRRFQDLKIKRSDKIFRLAGGLSPENVRNALYQTEAQAIDVNSGVESAPGIKDHVKLRALFDAVDSFACEGV